MCKYNASAQIIFLLVNSFTLNWLMHTIQKPIIWASLSCCFSFPTVIKQTGPKKSDWLQMSIHILLYIFFLTQKPRLITKDKKKFKSSVSLYSRRYHFVVANNKTLWTECKQDLISSLYFRVFLPNGPSPADSKTWAASCDTTVTAPTADSWFTSPFGVPSGIITNPCFWKYKRKTFYSFKTSAKK